MLWTDDEREHLKRLSPRYSVKEIAKRLGRSFASIRSAIERQRCGRPKLDTWSTSETDLLRILWPQHSASLIAERLGRSRNAVIGQVHRMRRRGADLRVKPLHGLRLIQIEAPRPKPIPPHLKAKPNRMTPEKPRAVIQCPCQLVELEPGVNCKWPYGDPVKPGFYFCGARTFKGLPYCPEHQREAHHDRPRSSVA